MTLSKELLTHMQWYFTREVNRLQDFMSFPSEIYRYETYTKYLEEVRIALKEHESRRAVFVFGTTKRFVKTRGKTAIGLLV